MAGRLVVFNLRTSELIIFQVAADQTSLTKIKGGHTLEFNKLIICRTSQKVQDALRNNNKDHFYLLDNLNKVQRTEKLE